MVPVRRVALSPLCADKVLERAVKARHLEQPAPPDVALGRAAAAAAPGTHVIVVALSRTTRVPERKGVFLVTKISAELEKLPLCLAPKRIFDQSLLYTQ